ncbi:hypothetical protein Leryth_010623 [Lithospermum erythrorhizon]|nr:hypothetical protein Leryth_010623 [Lithospermum erythrorhizon]
MSHVLRPFIPLPRRHHRLLSAATITHLLKPQPPTPTTTTYPHSSRKYTQSSSLHRYPHFNLNALRLRDSPPPEISELSDDEDESSRSRNEKKRVARRAVKFGIQLSKFSATQIKRILKVASLHREVLDAILLVKKLGREAKRRQYNLIGKFLRDVDPELMDSLLVATLEGDKKKFEKLFGLGSWDIKEDEDDAHDIESEDDEEDSQYHNDMVERWCAGLTNKDIGITNEVYSLHEIEFDRQELRRLVRRVHSLQENQISSEEKAEEADAKNLRARRSLTRFLRNIAKQIPDD